MHVVMLCISSCLIFASDIHSRNGYYILVSVREVARAPFFRHILYTVGPGSLALRFLMCRSSL